MIRINREVGAKVIVKHVLVDINPKDRFKYIKKISGTIVPNIDLEYYFHVAFGGCKSYSKHIINNSFQTIAIKLDNGVTDIEGNNIIVVSLHNIKFVDRIEIKPKPVTEKQYHNALNIIKRYEQENNI